MNYITKEYLEIISQLDIRLKERYDKSSDTPKEDIFARALKFNEEVWELNSEILSKYYKRRNGEFNQNNLEDEFADVIWTLLLLAKSMDIDINKSLKNKLDKIEKRGWL